MLAPIIVLLAACKGPAGGDPTESTPRPADTDTDADTDADTDTDTDTDADTDTDVPITDDISHVKAVLLEDFGTVSRVSWSQGVAGQVYVGFRYEGEPWQQSPTRAAQVGANEALVLGVPYGVDVEYRVMADFGKGMVGSAPEHVTTAPYPETLPVPQVLQADASHWEPSTPYVLTSMNQEGDDRYGDWWTFILDRQGRVLWARFTDPDYVSRYVRVSYDGSSILVDHNSAWPQSDDGADSYVVRMTLDGTQLDVFDTPGLHHSYTELPDGALVWMALQDGYNHESLETSDVDGPQRTIWDCLDDYISVYELPAYSCGTNGLFWDPATDRFLISSWAIDTVIEVDHASGATTRWFGQMEGSWGFDPADSEFDWQHGPIYTDAGTLMVSSKRYDDVMERFETVAYEYALDEPARMLREIWSFGKGEGIYGMYMGEVHRLPGGNTLHNYGEESRLREVQPDGTIVWEVWWEGDRHIGRSTPLAGLYDLVPP